MKLTLWLTTEVMFLYLLLTTVRLIPVQPMDAWALVARIWALLLSCCLSRILTAWQTWVKIGFRSTGNSVRQNFPRKKELIFLKKCWFECFCSRIYLRWHNPQMPLEVLYITLQVEGRKAASDRKVRLCVAFLKFMWLRVGRKKCTGLSALVHWTASFILLFLSFSFSSGPISLLTLSGYPFSTLSPSSPTSTYLFFCLTRSLFCKCGFFSI